MFLLIKKPDTNQTNLYFMEWFTYFDTMRAPVAQVTTPVAQVAYPYYLVSIFSLFCFSLCSAAHKQEQNLLFRKLY